MPSTKLGPSLVHWIESLAPTLPSLSELDESTSKPRRVVTRLQDLNDGVVLGDILGEVDPAYFRPQSATTSSQKALTDNWVLRFNNLKRLYKLQIRYFEDVLHSSTAALPAPNLQLIAKGGEGADEETCRLAGMVLALVVQSDQKQQHIERIQSLDEWVQRELMWSIEQVMSKISVKGEKDKEASMILGADADSEFYDLQHERSRLLSDKNTLQDVYEELMRNYRSLKDDHEEALGNLAAAEAKAADAVAKNDAGKNERADVAFKGEMDRLRNDLQKAENELGESEQLVERQTKMLEDLTRKVDELTPRAEEATRLKDQMDEYKHAAEKAKKTENVIEKYKKKLEESADLRRSIKTLEDQNSDLLDKNAALEEEYKKVSAFKPLMESYKTQLDQLELKSSQLAKDNDKLRHDVQRTKEKLRASEAEREKEREALALFEERVQELEHTGGGKKRAGRNSSVGELEDDGSFAGVGGELDDAISGTTMTDLKLQVRKLKRELEEAKANKADGSRIVVLENLLDDANRMKARYEGDYLREHREKLVVVGQLEEIRNGKSKHGDGPEATIALRMRLNETVEELDALRKENAGLDVKFTKQNKELTIAKSDLNLVNKDQLDILKSLRASVSVEKDALTEEVERLRASLQAAEDKVKMQMSQVNSLLMEKVSLQSDGLSQREREIARERDVGELKASLSGKGLSEADRERFATLEAEHSKSQAEVKELQEKLQKAKAFIKQQDKLFKEAHADEHHGNFEEAEQSYRSQIATLTEELERQKTNTAEVEARYLRENQLMLSAWHHLGLQTMRNSVAASPSSPAGGQAWLGQQRARAAGRGLRHA
ncbi:protein-nucleus import-related protein [Pseudohyphozyma bogoriensis]|nr:protein-nucleus import-related protein [Pseudohyphozyma bogoriensis]